MCHDLFAITCMLQHYAVMDASEHQVFVAVYHPEDGITNLYISDVTGVEYSYSLGDIVGPSSPRDWEPGNNPRFDIHVVSFGHLMLVMGLGQLN